MQSLKVITMAAAVASLASMSLGQTNLTQLWKHSDSQAGAPAWLNGGNTTRGMGYNPATGNVLVADRDGTTNTVHILAGATGVDGGNTLNGAYALGTFVLNKVDVAGDGNIYVANLFGGAGSTLKIYKHTSESVNVVPIEAVNLTTPLGASGRLGDDMDVIGSGNNTKIVMTGSGNLNAGIFTTTDGGNTFTGASITPSNPALLGITPVRWHTDATNIWLRKAASTVTETTTNTFCDSTGAGQWGVIGIQGYSPFDVKDFGGSKGIFIGVGPCIATATAGPWPAFIYKVNVAGQSASLAAQTASSVESSAGPQANGNASGDVALDVAGNRMFVLATNNSLSGWSIPANTAVSDWNLF